jgi:tetratricopeptide (TPR) repeat protein
MGLKRHSLFALTSLALTLESARAEVPDFLEPDYSEAVLSFNDRQYRKAIQQLDQLLKKNPEVVEFLELKALSLKATQNDADAVGIYERLIESRKKSGAKEKDLAPYHFELGMILTRQKKTAEARSHFEFSVREEFNLAPAHLYLGLDAFNTGRWGDAERHFKGVLSERVADLAPLAYFYLGQTYMRLEFPSGATSNLVSARDAARRVIENSSSSADIQKMAQSIFDATSKALAPYDRGQMFGYVGTISGYDSNILLAPSTVSSAAQTSGNSTLKQTLMAGVGYASSSLAMFQYVPSIRVSTNLNTSEDAATSQFVTNSASLYLTGLPLSRFSFGAKLEGVVMFRKETDPSLYRIFSQSGSLGPFFRYQATRSYLWGLEYTLEPRSYADDPSGDQARSGTGDQLRTYLQNERGSRYFNPTYVFRLGSDGARGAEWASHSIGGDLSNAFHLSEKVDLNLSLSYSYQTYDARPSGKRVDKNYLGQFSASWRWRPKWTFLASATQTQNDSNVPDTYSYSRLETGLGVTYSF